MFGAKEQEIEKMVNSGKWDKIEKKFLYSNDENRLALAKVLSTTSADEGYNALVSLIKDENPTVQLEAIKSLGATGAERAAAQLQWVLAKTAPTNTATIAALKDAIAQVRTRKR
ncbi:MAG: HEAT repeat domain-containing protein [Oscillospiraceae bacterium]